MFNVKKISKSFGEQVILKDFNLEAKNGDVIGIVGRTGCGKSTLLNILGGYDFCDSGEVLFDNVNHSNLNGKEVNYFRKNRIAFLFQDGNLLSDMTVFENLKLSVQLNKSLYYKIDEYLNKLNLLDLKYKKVSNLSGGEKQRIAFIRAIIKEFDVLICDEPTGSLDDANSIIILDLIKQECKDKIVIIVTHKKSISNLYFNKKYVYDDERKKFELLFDNSEDLMIEHKVKSNKYVSIIGLFKHSLARFSSNKIPNILILILMTMFVIAVSLSGIFSEEIFRRIHIDYEKQFFPLEQIEVVADDEYIERLDIIEEVDTVVRKKVIRAAVKFYSWPYKGQTGVLERVHASLFVPGNLIELTEFNDNVEIEKFYINGECRPDRSNIAITEVKDNGRFIHSNLVYGKLPEGDEVLIDATTAIDLLNMTYYNHKDYINGTLTTEEIHNAVKGQYLQFYTVGDLVEGEDENLSQGIDLVKFRISGIIKTRYNSEYLTGVYAPTQAFDKITFFEYNLKHESNLIYKIDDKRLTHEYLMDNLYFRYKINDSHLTLYKEAYQKVKSIVDISLLFAQIGTIVFFIGIVVLLSNIFMKNKYEIAVYRSLGYSTSVTTVVLGLNYIFSVVIGTLLAYLSNKFIFSKLLKYGDLLDGIFLNHSLYAFCSLIIVVNGVILVTVMRNNKKSINEILR